MSEDIPGIFATFSHIFFGKWTRPAEWLAISRSQPKETRLGNRPPLPGTHGSEPRTIAGARSDLSYSLLIRFSYPELLHRFPPREGILEIDLVI